MAEDNELNAMIAKEILESMGAAVDVAGDGQKAVDSFASHPVDYYDFILMDVQMPVMDGREASRTIRAMDRPDARSLLIFGLSADAFVEDERLSLESGMNGHYAKPVDYEALRENVGRFLREKA
ncbi:MAG: response regulator [Eubacteriales bacterium]